MISREGKDNFLVAHYDWIALGVGLLALCAGAAYYVMSLGADADEAAAVSAAEVDRLKPAKTGVKALDMDKLNQAVRLTRKPVQMVEVTEKAESFLASEKRVMCKCKKAIPGDVKAFPKCPYCGERQEEEKKVVLDADGDGLPDEWEKKFGLNPNKPGDAAEDSDGDGFTNLEEFAAKTNPLDKKDHPDYLDSLKIVLPLKSTYLPFVFTKAIQIPSGWRCEFFDAKQKDDYGRLGRRLTAVIGEQVGTSGFTLKAYEKKETKREIKGAQGLMKTVDVSEVTLVRKSDGKTITLVLVENKKTAKPTAVDVQATLVYERGETKNFEVVPGSEIVLTGYKYRVTDIQAVGKSAKVTVENALTGKKRTLEALEQ